MGCKAGKEATYQDMRSSLGLQELVCSILEKFQGVVHSLVKQLHLTQLIHQITHNCWRVPPRVSM